MQPACQLMMAVGCAGLHCWKWECLETLNANHLAAQIFAKRPHSGDSAFQWHQDQAYWWVDDEWPPTAPQMFVPSMADHKPAHQLSGPDTSFLSAALASPITRPPLNLRRTPLFSPALALYLPGHRSSQTPQQSTAGWLSVMSPWRMAACATCLAATARVPHGRTVQVCVDDAC